MNRQEESPDIEAEISASAQGLHERIKQSGGQYSETLNILPSGKIDLSGQKDSTLSLFANLADESRESIMARAKEIQDRFPDLSFNFEMDPHGKLLKYTVSEKRENLEQAA